ncbi:MAG TPA: aquaporin [Candidatus Limnocylindria bacterium]|nr:aquaporin [Candidatus Limnocylindria bacterium]
MTGHTRALLAEAAGTFWFFLIGAGAIVTNAATNNAVGLVGIALAHGLALAVAISSFGAISGGHFNPAVTVGLAVARKHPWERVPTYIGAQLVGALAAGILLRLIFDFVPAAMDTSKLGTPIVAGGVTLLNAIVIEAVLTLFLLWAVFGTAVSPNAPRIAGFGIGLAVTADILIGGPLTGASMNPARWFGPAIASGFLRDGAVHIVGPLLGAALAGISYLYIFGSEPEREKIEATPPRPRPVPPPSDRTERL